MMVSVEATGNLERRMHVKVPAERIEGEIESRLRQVGRTAKLQGFRPGKIPAKIIRQKYGSQVRREVLSEFMQSSYSEALQREKLVPAGGPQIEPESVSEGEDLAYVATFEIYPEIELRDVERIPVERPAVEITAADVDEMLESLRRQKATWETVGRPAGEGDQVVVDFDGTIKGEPIPRGRGEKVPVVLGSGGMLPDFEKALKGVEAGEEKSFKVKYPKDYPVEELAGRKADFTAKVHEVQEQRLPALDDELAKAFGVEEGGVEALRRDVERNMRRELELKRRADLKEQVLGGLLARNPVEIPKSLHEQEMHTLQHDAMRRLGIEDHDQAPPKESFAEPAERRVKLGLLVQELIRTENIELDRERVRERVVEMFADYENPEQYVTSFLSNPQFMAQIEPSVLEDQAVDWLLGKAEETRRELGFGEYMNA